MSVRQIFNYFEIAGRIASNRRGKKTYLLAAVGIRSDGQMVQSVNGHSLSPTPPAHAEARLSRKLDKNATVFVARILLSDGSFAMAKPCQNCMRSLRSKKVKRVYYTISNNEYGVIDL